MRLYEAMRIFGINDNELNRDEVKNIFRLLAKANHPDKGGDSEKMKEIYESFEILKNQYSFLLKESKNQGFEEDENFWVIDNIEMEEAYKAISGLDEIKIEVCGFWVWVTGNTYKHKAALKAAGFRFASKKIAWYWKSETQKTYSRGNASLNEIRVKYGSKKAKISKKLS